MRGRQRRALTDDAHCVVVVVRYARHLLRLSDSLILLSDVDVAASISNCQQYIVSVRVTQAVVLQQSLENANDRFQHNATLL